MNRLFLKLVAGLLTVLAVDASAAAMNLQDGDRVQLSWVGNHGATTDAGAFTTTGVGSTTGDSFLTFCLERTEYISLNTPYFVDISTSANGGGYGGQTSPGVDPLSYSSAWLYTNFRDGNLGNGAFSGFSYDSNASMDAVQLAFWKMEGELDRSWTNIYNANSLAKSLVVAAEGSGWTSLGNVRVMNLYSGYSNGKFVGPAQSQLYLTPVPEPETYAMLIAGLGLMVIVIRRRHREFNRSA